MKINFLSFLNPFKKGFVGGGELINRQIINDARLFGIDIKYGYRENTLISRILPPSMNLHKNPDLWILSDIFNIPTHRISFQRDFLMDIITNQKFIHFDNAYVDICANGALPCNGLRSSLCQNCLKNPSRELLYKNSLANFFLSPLHLKTINQYFGNIYLNKSHIVDPFIDTKNFCNLNIERDIEYLYVGTISGYKGYENIKDKFENIGDDFYFVGPKSKSLKLFSNNYLGIKSTKELPLIYNRAKNFVHLPTWKEPMARTVLEAALCGCNLIVNENVGATSFDFDLSNSDNYVNNIEKFYKTISNLI
ncbi:glycosyltransferase [Sediminibacterium sp.]|uniref:glycosyltransferase n=1 Tax=Sediminibacterium sp. TaxID=1917865 RepID=UPI003F727C9E